MAAVQDFFQNFSEDGILHLGGTLNHKINFSLFKCSEFLRVDSGLICTGISKQIKSFVNPFNTSQRPKI